MYLLQHLSIPAVAYFALLASVILRKREEFVLTALG
jgi:hypothetical protein